MKKEIIEAILKKSKKHQERHGRFDANYLSCLVWDAAKDFPASQRKKQYRYVCNLINKVHAMALK